MIFTEQPCEILWKHSVEKREIVYHQKIFRQINSLVNYIYIKTVTFTEFLLKMREREFP